jgi:nucleotide-binding universal stress UspA family protein
MTTLLIAYDGSPGARAAVMHAGRELAGAAAIVAGVAGHLPSLDEAGAARLALPDAVARGGLARLRELAVQAVEAQCAEGVELAREAGLQARPEAIETPGSVWRALLDAAGAAGADAVVCGTRGLGPLSRAVLGSTSTALIHHAELPVLLVPEGEAPARGPLVVGYDGSEHAQRAVAACGRLLAGRPAIVVHAWTSPLKRTLTGRAVQAVPLDEVRGIVADFDETLAGGARDEAEHGARAATAAGLDATARAVESGGSIAQTLLTVAGDAGASALIVGRRGRGAVAAAVLGSVSAALAHATDRPLLIVP